MSWVPNRRQAIIWTNADPIHWHIYVALGGDKLTMKGHLSWKTSLYSGYFIQVSLCNGWLSFKSFLTQKRPDTSTTISLENGMCKKRTALCNQSDINSARVRSPTPSNTWLISSTDAWSGHRHCRRNIDILTVIAPSNSTNHTIQYISENV